MNLKFMPLIPATSVGGMVKALACAFRWSEMLEVGKYSTIKEMAAAEKTNHI